MSRKGTGFLRGDREVQRKRLKMSTKRVLNTLAVMAVMLSVAVLPAMAESELDQSQTTVQAGTPVSWGGNNNLGQIDVPSGLTDVVDVAAGGGHNLALKSDGTVVAWGYNSNGQTDVPSGLTDVVDVAAGDYHSLALTQKSPDTTPPKVIGTVPKANATEVTTAANVRATFSEEMDSNTIDGTTFMLFEKGTTKQIAAQVSYNADTDTAKLDPTNNLRRGVAYKAVVSTWVKDVAGKRLDQDGATSGLQQMRWFFRVDD